MNAFAVMSGNESFFLRLDTTPQCISCKTAKLLSDIPLSKVCVPLAKVCIPLAKVWLTHTSCQACDSVYAHY